MSLVTIECPVCRRWTVFNGRGRCRCGAYLVDHAKPGSIVPPGAIIVKRPVK